MSMAAMFSPANESRKRAEARSRLGRLERYFVVQQLGGFRRYGLRPLNHFDVRLLFTTAPADDLENWPRLASELRLHGSRGQFDERNGAGMSKPHTPDLITEIGDGAAATPARSAEREGLGRLRIDEVHKPAVLPRIAWSNAVGPELPLCPVEVAECLA